MSITQRLPAGMQVIERNWLSSNLIVFQEGHACSVVDTGYHTHGAITEALIDRARADRPLVRILNTHLHSDHCGGNARLAARHGCEILVPEASFEAARHWDETLLSYEATGQLCERFTPTGRLRPGESLRLVDQRWEVLAAPGHDPDSVILFQPDTRILISADALWQEGFGVIFPELIGESGFAEQAAILDLIESLAPAVVIPGHGPVFSAVDAAIGRARSRLAYFRDRPLRHAQYAIKVLVSYLMMELEHASREQLQHRLARASLIARSAALLGRSHDEALSEAIDSLVEGGQLREHEGVLRTAG
jgi:glyoxylase-like metal-dependent hydrolase (beta-lactamase superfamily II)